MVSSIGAAIARPWARKRATSGPSTASPNAATGLSPAWRLLASITTSAAAGSLASSTAATPTAMPAP